jgi:hypothetical protein
MDIWLSPQACTGKRRSVVRTQHLRHTAFPEHPLKAGNDKPAVRHIGGIARQHYPAAVVGQRERMTPAPAGMSKFTLEIGTPDIIGVDDSM